MRDVYSGRLKLSGEESRETLIAANNYANHLLIVQRFGEAKSLLRRTIPVARRVFAENNRLTLGMQQIYAKTLYTDPDATLSDLREAVTTLEDTERIARRVFGSSNQFVVLIGQSREEASAALRARETPSA